MKFLEELSATLDMDAAMRRAGISAEEAKGILKALIPHGESPVAHAPGKEAGHRPAGSCDVYVDGASRGNPGRAGAGAMIVGPGGEVLKRLRRYLGVTTNNVAEYEALIMALEEASSLGCRRIKAYADSELMVRQLNGEYAVRSEVLKPLFGKVLKLIRSFEAFSISHVYREKNKDADTLANEAIDSGTG